MTKLSQCGLGLAVLMTMTGLASAQDRKDFKKPFDGGNRGAEAVERARAEMKAMEGQIQRLKQEIDNTNRKLERLQAADKGGDKGKGFDKGKFGPPDFKGGPPWAGRGPGMDKKGPAEEAKGGRPDFKGPPWAERMMEMKKKAMAERPDFKDSPWAERMAEMRKKAMAERPDFKGGPPWAGRGPGAWGPPDMRGKGGPSAPPARSDARADAGRSRGPSADLESRVNRLERAVDELRREVRNRR